MAETKEFQFNNKLLFIFALISFGLTAWIISMDEVKLTHAAAVSCPATDGGAGDDDATADGLITINSNATWDTTGFAANSDHWDCTGVNILITNNATLTFEGDTSNGYHPFLKTDNLQIDSGSSISGDLQGCTGTHGDGYAPNASNVCTQSASGSGSGGGTGDKGYGGGGNAGEGGDGMTNTGGSRIEDMLTPTHFGSSGGGGGQSNDVNGGIGGGAIHIELTGTLTHNGKITANGEDGGVQSNNKKGAGGGAGGSIFIEVDTLTGSGTFEATGGDGGNGSSHANSDGGGAGGGYITLHYNVDSMGLQDNDFNVSGGTKAGNAEDGDMGIVYAKDIDDSLGTIFKGFYLSEDDSSLYTDADDWVYDSNAVINCEDNVVTVGVYANSDLTLGGTWNCSESTLTDFDVSAISTLSISSGTNMDFSGAKKGLDVDFTLPNNQTWTNFTLTGASEGELTIDDAKSITLSGSTAIDSNVNWSNLTDVSIASGARIRASEKGCSTTTSGSGSGPNGSNVCTDNTAGYGLGPTSGGIHKGSGGGGHGGAGGIGVSPNHSDMPGGSTYGDSTAPILFGSSGGNAKDNAYGGAGGGRINISNTGTFTHNGELSADGENGEIVILTKDNAAGGGSGGSIYINTATYTGTTGSFSATGGNGANATSADGGGGGGGRISVVYNTDNSSFLSGLSANSITMGGSSENAGSIGTFFKGSGEPSVDSITISTSSGGATASAINLTENSTSTIYIHGEISDTDSCTDVETNGTVSGTFYRTNVTGAENCTADNNDCYQIASCTLTDCSGGGDNTFSYECSANIQYYADATDTGSNNEATDWTAKITAEDASANTASNTSTTEINSLLGIDFTSNINYGAISLASESSQQDISITNTGNSPVDLEIKGDADMSCTTGTVDVGQVHYSNTNSFVYASGTSLTTTLNSHQFDLNPQSNDLSPSIKSLYTKLEMPESGVAGSCSNTLTINAVTDS